MKLARKQLLSANHKQVNKSNPTSQIPNNLIMSPVLQKIRQSRQNSAHPVVSTGLGHSNSGIQNLTTGLSERAESVGRKRLRSQSTSGLIFINNRDGSKYERVRAAR